MPPLEVVVEVPACVTVTSLAAAPCGQPAPMVFIGMCVHEHLTESPRCFDCCDVDLPVHCVPCTAAGHLCEVDVTEIGQPYAWVTARVDVEGMAWCGGDLT